MTWVAALAIAAAAAAAPPPDAAQTVYHECFDHYGVTPPAFTAACAIAEYPPSLKHLEFRPVKPASVYAGPFFKLPGSAQGLTDFELEFSFRFPNANPKSLDVRLDFLAGGDARKPAYSTCTLKISADLCGVTSVSNHAPLLPPTRTPTRETALHPLLGGHLYRARVRVRGGSLEAHVDGPGTTVRIGRADVPAAPLAGFNFGGASAFDLDDIILRKVPAAPADDFRDDAGGARVATRTAEFKLAFPASANTARARVRLGSPGEMRIHLNWADGATLPISVSTFAATVNLPVIGDRATLKDGKLVSSPPSSRKAAPSPTRACASARSPPSARRGIGS